MKKSTKVMVVLAGLVGVQGGNMLTNYIIMKKNGYKWNKETKRYEKVCPFGIDLVTEDQIAKSNLIWQVIGLITGIVVRIKIVKK